MTASHNRRIQGRRALAILAWITLTIVAGLLWYAQANRLIRVQAWEPAALLLSVFAAFLAIFGWQLFAPERAAAEESPGIFFGGMLTLLPPCFIAYHLMPVDSPLRGWVTIAVFALGLIAILSPLPTEVFAVPRDRRSYLRPLTDSYLSTLDTSEPETGFDHLLPRTQFRLTRPAVDSETDPADRSRDPWSDPFAGTGRQLSRIGVSRSRRAETVEPAEVHPIPPPVPVDRSAEVDAELERMRRERINREAPTRSRATPEDDSSSLRVSGRADAFRTINPVPPPVPQMTSIPAAPMTSPSRRPLTEPGQKLNGPVGFQMPSSPAPPVVPVVMQPVIPSAPVVALPPTFPVSTVPVAATIAAAPAAATAMQSKSRPTEFSVQELDRQFREQASEDELDVDADETLDEVFAGQLPGPAAGISRSGKISAGEATYERISDEAGGELIEGTIPVFFEIGQKRAHLHVPFSPPLASVPDVECEPTDDDSIRLKVALRQPYGIRIEARRSEASDELRTEISFSAVATPRRR